MPLRKRPCGRVGWVEGQLSKTAEVLGNGGERELELRTCRSPEPQSTHAKNALQMREQHLDFLAIASCLLVCSRLGDGAGEIARRLVNVPRDSAARGFLGASRIVEARAGIRGGRGG